MAQKLGRWNCFAKEASTPTVCQFAGGRPISLNDHSIPVTHQSRRGQNIDLAFIWAWAMTTNSLLCHFNSHLSEKCCVWQARVDCPLWLNSFRLELDIIPGHRGLERKDACLTMILHQAISTPVGLERGYRKESLLQLYNSCFRSSAKGTSSLLRTSGRTLGVAGDSSLILICGSCVFFSVMSSLNLED
jgi:hypothetical protein